MPVAGAALRSLESGARVCGADGAKKAGKSRLHRRDERARRFRPCRLALGGGDTVEM